LNEYLKVIQKIDKDALVSEQWITLIAENSILTSDKKTFRLSQDPDDNKFLDCAGIGRADFIVSGDKHLLSLGHVFSIPICGPTEFLKAL